MAGVGFGKRARRRLSCSPWALFAAVLLPFAFARGATLVVGVDDGAAPLADAVVSLDSPSAAAAVRPAHAELDQSGSQFVPRVLAITRGTQVTFPNRDKVRHHVYSFSPVKRFELPLYAGSPAAPVQFDSPGLATLGCNIHDWMVAYVLVLDTPYFGKTDADGRLAIDAPAGEYVLRAWHEQLGDGQAALERSITLTSAGGTEQVSLAVDSAATDEPGKASASVAADVDRAP